MATQLWQLPATALARLYRQRVITPADALEAVRDCFASMARGEARNFPVVREALEETAHSFAPTALIGVSATDGNDALTSWSSYGAHVSLSAPGTGRRLHPA